MSMVKVVDRNIRALLEHRQEQRVSRSRKERVVDAVTGFAGSMSFVYLHLAVFGLWILANRGGCPACPGSIPRSSLWRWWPRSRPCSSPHSS